MVASMTKMTKKQFRHDFLRGLGSALLELRQNENPQQYLEIVRYGCLHNTTYDMQSEGDRGWYLHQAATLVDGAILNDIVEKYSKKFSDDWLFNQLTSILYYFAADGNEAAYSVLYDKYDFLLDKLSRIVISKHRPICPDRDMFGWLCVWLTSLDGWDAFTMIVNDVSDRLFSISTGHEDFFYDMWFYVNSKGKFGKKRVDAYLQKQAAKSEHIKKFWRKTRESDNSDKGEQTIPTLEDVIAKAGDSGIRGISLRFAKNASADDLRKLYFAAMQEDDDKTRVGMLWGLRFATAPVSEGFISDLMKNDNRDIRGIAFRLMESNPSPKMREIAITLIQQESDEITLALSLLSKNILPEDEQLFCDTIKAIPANFSGGKWHDAFICARNGIEKLRGKPKTDLLLYVYRNTHCGFCREAIVRLMYKKKILTSAILQECLHDSNYDIRIFAKRITSKHRQIEK